jgi:hypothetical protein
MVEWRDINGYEGLYLVNSGGDIYSVRANKVLKQFYRGSRADNKYLVVDLNSGGNRKTVSVHRVVAEAFIPNPNNLPCVNHKDGNKDNNCSDNLEWCTYSENNYHAFRTGLKNIPSGTKNKNSKLSYDDVVAIKKCLILGDPEYGTRPLSRKYGVDHNVILDIYHNRKYQDVHIPYTYFVSSDIHSAYTIWMDALKKAGFNKNKYSHKIIVCGDLFDRMDETVQTYWFAKEMCEQDRFIYIKGNHESLLFDCVHEIRCGRVPSSHHFHNGTVKTICQFCGQSEWIVYDPTWRDKICETMQPVLDFISDNCVDYAELGDYIFVHGWVPCYKGLDDFRNASSEDWERARWDNGMEMWSYPRCRVGGKTVVVGHWHCSWGWSHLKQERKEFPKKNRVDWQKSFEPFVDDGIIALDACTAYSGLCNVIVIEYGGEEQ